MFSSYKKWSPLFCALTLFTLGCSQENSPYNDITKVDLKGASCLSSSTKKIENFFDGKATQTEVDEIWDCFSNAVKTFEGYVKGVDETTYTAQGLRQFLETYFIAKRANKEKHAISDALLDEMMEIKRLFLGGSRDHVTKAELLTTIRLIEQFRYISHKLRPYNNIIFQNQEAMPPIQDFEHATRIFQDAVQDLVKQFHPEASNYQLMRLERLLLELADFFQDEKSDANFDVVAKFVPALTNIKQILLNSDSQIVSAHEWPAVGRAFATAYIAGLRFKYFFDGESLYDITKLGQVRAAVDDGISILRQAFVRRMGSPITVSELEPLLVELDRIDFLPFGLSSGDTVAFLERFFDFILNPQNAHPATGLSTEKLDYIERELEGWSRVQKSMVTRSFSPEEPDWQEMERVLATPWAVSMDTLDRIVIDGDKVNPTNLAGQSRMNWSRALFRILLRAYIGDRERREVKMELSKKELHQAYMDLKPILAGLGLVDKEDTDFDVRLFRDANLFMTRSDGDRFLDFYELIEYLHFVYSGLSAGDVLLNQIDPSCHVDLERIDVGCFRNFFQFNKDVHFAHLPFYLRYTRGLSQKDFLRDIRNIEKTNRDEGASPAPILRADIYEAFVLLQYIEVIMLRYDKNQSGALDLFEALQALELFKYTIGDFLSLNPDKPQEMLEIEILFTYMLKHGDFPNPSDPLAQLKLSNWRWQKGKWEIAANRGILFQILATISQMN